MKLTSKLSAAAVAATISLAAPASAGLIDFTDSATGLTGSLASGIGWTVTGEPTDPNNNQPFDGGDVSAISPLKGEKDGFGIRGDEVTNGNNFQSVTITFDEEVKLYTAFFLDVFVGNNGTESARMLVDGVATSDTPFDAEVLGTDLNPGQFNNDNDGFETITGVFKGTSFTFFAGPGKDDATADISLAGVTVAAVPLPAGFLLLGTALGGLGLARRRKKA